MYITLFIYFQELFGFGPAKVIHKTIRSQRSKMPVFIKNIRSNPAAIIITKVVIIPTNNTRSKIILAIPTNSTRSKIIRFTPANTAVHLPAKNRVFITENRSAIASAVTRLAPTYDVTDVTVICPVQFDPSACIGFFTAQRPKSREAFPFFFFFFFFSFFLFTSYQLFVFVSQHNFLRFTPSRFSF